MYVLNKHSDCTMFHQVPLALSPQPSAKAVQCAKNVVPHVENPSLAMQLSNSAKSTTVAVSNLKNAVEKVCFFADTYVVLI